MCTGRASSSTCSPRRAFRYIASPSTFFAEYCGGTCLPAPAKLDNASPTDQTEALARYLVNRAGLGDDSVYGFCRERAIPILAEIPFDRALAEAYSRGEILAEASERMGRLFSGLAANIAELASVRAPVEEVASA